jgi:hypothetical protein
MNFLDSKYNLFCILKYLLGIFHKFHKSPKFQEKKINFYLFKIFLKIKFIAGQNILSF